MELTSVCWLAAPSCVTLGGQLITAPGADLPSAGRAVTSIDSSAKIAQPGGHVPAPDSQNATHGSVPTGTAAANSSNEGAALHRPGMHAEQGGKESQQQQAAADAGAEQAALQLLAAGDAPAMQQLEAAAGLSQTAEANGKAAAGLSENSELNSGESLLSREKIDQSSPGQCRHYWGQAVQYLESAVQVTPGRRILLLAKRDGSQVRA